MFLKLFVYESPCNCFPSRQLIQLTDEREQESERHHEVPDVGASRVDVELEAEGDCQEDEHLQEVVPRSKGLQSRKNLKDQNKE